MMLLSKKVSTVYWMVRMSQNILGGGGGIMVALEVTYHSSSFLLPASRSQLLASSISHQRIASAYHISVSPFTKH